MPDDYLISRAGELEGKLYLAERDLDEAKERIKELEEEIDRLKKLIHNNSNIRVIL